MNSAVIGVDVGGTKTAGVLANLQGGVLEISVGGPGNYQAIGLDAAARVYAEVIAPLMARARTHGVDVHASAFGLCGLDRPVDAERLEGVLCPLVTAGAPMTLVNDTDLILRAGTHDGVGVAVVSGTGSNCIGRSAAGQQARIGGFGHDFGDDGSAEDIGREGARAVFRAEDGRAPATALSALITTRFGLTHIYELVERFLVDATEGEASLGEIAPLVFEAAAGGDAVCAQILTHAGEELGHAAVVVGRQLFEPDAPLPVVLGGSVWQRGEGETMRDAFKGRVTRDFPQADVRTLSSPPVTGALLLAMDALGDVRARSEALHARLGDALRGRI